MNGQTSEAAVGVEAGRALEIARLTASQNVRKLEGSHIPFYVDTAGKLCSLEHLLDEPLRIKEDPHFPDLGSFCAYVNRYKNADTTFYGQKNNSLVLAVIDHYGPDQPSRQTHTATLDLLQSEEWKAWTANSGRYMDQVQFAEWIEMRELDFHSPEPNKLLEAAMHFKLSSDHQFESKINLVNGAAVFKHSEDIKEVGDIKLPIDWTLGLRVYEHGAPVECKAKVRYRMENKKIRLQYTLLRPDRILDAAFGHVADQVRAACPDVAFYHGTP